MRLVEDDEVVFEKHRRLRHLLSILPSRLKKSVWFKTRTSAARMRFAGALKEADAVLFAGNSD